MLQCTNVFICLSACAGVIIGLILKYALKPNEAAEYYLVCEGGCESQCSKEDRFEVGKDIHLISPRGDAFIAEILGRSFQDQNGNYIEQTVSEVFLRYM